MTIDIAGQIVYLAFIQVSYDAQRADRIAVKRAVADRYLALVGGGEQNVAELVRYGHHHHAPDARLHIFLGYIERQFAEDRTERCRKRGERLVDRNDLVFDAQIFRQLARVFHRMIGGKLRRHQ